MMSTCFTAPDHGGEVPAAGSGCLEHVRIVLYTEAVELPSAVSNSRC